MTPANPGPIPARCDVVVIGGGPAGSSTATLLARDGLEVVLLEKARHPRPQVGESLIPHIWKYADLLGVSDALQAEGFVPKAGGIVVWNDRMRQVRFSDFGYRSRGGLHVERDRFDEILLRHAERSGARVFEEVPARAVDLQGGARAVVAYEDRRGGGSAEGRVECSYVVDASGSSALLASQLGARRLVGSGKYLGMWGYYEDSPFVGVDRRVHPPQALGSVKPVTFICSYEDGWAWHIVLRRCTSVGLVIGTGRARGAGRAAREQYFRETCAAIPHLGRLLEPARFRPGSMSFRPDYSYYSERVWGERFFCVGDAATFIDPIFSQGVLTAFFNAAICAWALSGSLREPSRRGFYGGVFERKLLEHYGFYRLLAFGDFGGDGIDPVLVRSLIGSLQRSELELSLVASAVTDREQNFRRMAQEAGLADLLGDEILAQKAERLDRLSW
jgi:flavin-dependent dehydrogenase